MKYIFLFLLFPLPLLAFSPQVVIEEVNEFRESQGLQGLSEQDELNVIAQDKAKDMCRKRYWAHSIDNKEETIWTFFKKHDYKFKTAGEVIGRRFRTEDELVAAWIASPTHKATLLLPKVKMTGVGRACGITVQVLADVPRGNLTK